ncbi:cell wall-binding repeat-containing protein [Herbiconiux liukaitaii]|uniref:cell wall-binding repeat-containing protein n=1 Tax=Herbiconiux liukaitaii TaxID=3342799 RepID=UPI0035BAE6EE
MSASRAHALTRTVARRASAIALTTALIVAGTLLAAPAQAAPAPPPIPAGVYLGAPWVKAGGEIAVQFVGATGCTSVSGVEFVETATGTRTPLETSGFGENFWEVREYSFVDRDFNPLPLGSGSPVAGRVVVSCTSGPTFELPLTVRPSAPSTIYNSPTAWTWYTPGGLTAGAPITVSALGFTPGETVTVALANQTRYDSSGDFAGTATAPVTAVADGEGAVTTTATLPSGWAATDVLRILAGGAIGKYLLVAGDGEPFNGDPSLGFTTDGLAIPGGSITVSGGGYAAGETVVVALHSPSARAVQLGTLTAAANGTISGSVSLPSSTAPGSYRLWAGARTISYHLLNAPLTVGVSARISAPDRYSNAVQIAKAAYPGAAEVVYVATGQNYPDALSAGAAAADAGGPLLLTTQNALPAEVKQAIQTLAPSRIVVVGGPNSVSAAVLDELRTITPNVVRQGGADRYEASRAIVEGQFDAATRAFIATGATFPDALSATSAAASVDAPVLLIPGTNPSVDPKTLALLDELGVTDITITGGPNSVSPAIEAQLKAKYGSARVTRLGGADRFEASVNINEQYFSTATEAYLATGLNFPDALAGGVLAAGKGAPLLVVRGDCVPATTREALSQWGVSKVTLLGGTASLTPAVGTLARCP